MNCKMITMFNVMPKATDANRRTFEEVNAEAAKYGWIIHPDCCSTVALDWVRKEAKTNYNKTFYAKWEDITSKTRFELLVDQLRHYASTYGTEFTCEGNGYVPNQNPDVEIPYKSFKVILPATDEEIYGRCVKMLQSGIALESATLDILIGYIVSEDRFEKYGLDIDTVKNKEAIIMLMDKTGKYGSDPFNMLRYFVYKATGKAMLIKDKRTIQAIKENAGKVDFTKLSDTQRRALASIFYRFKVLFTAFKHPSGKSGVFKNEAFRKAAAKLGAQVSKKESNASVINLIRKLAVTEHRPFRAGFWETVLTEQKDIATVKSKLAAGEITNFKKITLMQAVLEKLQNASGKMYVIRNGKMWVREKCKKTSKTMTSYLMSVYRELESSLVGTLKEKACTVRYPKHVNLTVPTSEKNFIGNYPFGTSVDMGDSHNVVGIYWRNEWGTRDFDLHMYDLEGHSYGWNSSFTNRDNTVVFSGDMTNADPEATELFYIDRKAPDGKISVSQYRGDEKSQFKLFVAREDMSGKLGEYRIHGAAVMCDPNNVLAEFIIPVDNE